VGYYNANSDNITWKVDLRHMEGSTILRLQYATLGKHRRRGPREAGSVASLISLLSCEHSVTQHSVSQHSTTHQYVSQADASMHIKIPCIAMIAAMRVAAYCGTPDPTPEQRRSAIDLQAQWTDPQLKSGMASVPVNISINV
jgi:hypothetical protein